MSDFWHSLAVLITNYPQGAAITFLVALGTICWTIVEVVKGIVGVFHARARAQVVMAERFARMHEGGTRPTTTWTPAPAPEADPPPVEPGEQQVSIYERLRSRP